MEHVQYAQVSFVVHFLSFNTYIENTRLVCFDIKFTR